MSEDEEDYVTFGKALKEFQEGERIRKRPISVEEQTVTDRNGKRRFHGAFTGGYSAGFFNTVDTPQGWAPSQFKSSRDSKADQKGQRPEDFMDDEDFGEFGFAPHALKTKANFQSMKETEKTTVGDRDVLAPVLSQLIQPSTSTVGQRLLIKQGWKPGQGIGPKANKKCKIERKSSYLKTYGGKDEELRVEDDPILDKYKDFLFAPDDIPVYVGKPKENLFGIGYQGLDRPGTFRASSSFNVRSGVDKKKFSISGEAFGVGAYEEDDDDIYSRNDMGQYDFSLDAGPSSGSRNHSGSGGSVDALANILDGFVLSTRKSALKKRFPAPHIPSDCKATVTGYSRKSRFDKVSEKEAAKVPNPSRDQRRALLFPNTNSQHESSPTTSSDIDIKAENDVKQEPVDVEFLDNRDNSIAEDYSDFKPFKSNPEKQKRYEQFLVCIKNNRRDGLRILQPKSMTEWERERERVEFEKAANLYKPMKVTMAARFVSAGTSKADENEGATADGEKGKAAQLKMFGKLTRETSEWVPARILCVRFNVRNPFDHEKDTKSKKKSKFGSNQLFSVLGAADKDTSVQKSSEEDREQTTDKGREAVQTEKNEDFSVGEKVKVKLAKDEENEDLGEKPSMDLFKAIFANSESESESEAEEHEPRPPPKANTVNLPRPSAIPVQSKDAQQQARGIFAGINFDKFIRKRPKSPTPIVREKVAPTRPKSILDQSVRTILGIRSGDQEEGDYGPALPPQASSTKKIVISSDSDSDHWVDKSKKAKKSKKHKKEKKKKKKKHKYKD